MHLLLIDRQCSFANTSVSTVFYAQPLLGIFLWVMWWCMAMTRCGHRGGISLVVVAHACMHDYLTRLRAPYSINRKDLACVDCPQGALHVYLGAWCVCGRGHFMLVLCVGRQFDAIPTMCFLRCSCYVACHRGYLWEVNCDIRWMRWVIS